VARSRARKAAQRNGHPGGRDRDRRARSRVEINRRARWYLCYRYDYGGRRLTGESHAMAAEWVEGFKPGDAVQIRIDPRKPEDSLFVGPG
jgi:hypothetical protein